MVGEFPLARVTRRCYDRPMRRIPSARYVCDVVHWHEPCPDDPVDFSYWPPRFRCRCGEQGSIQDFRRLNRFHLLELGALYDHEFFQ